MRSERMLQRSAHACPADAEPAAVQQPGN
jgi:hypothetical protein